MKNSNGFNLGWMTASMALHTAAASALVFASLDAANSSQKHNLKQQEQLIEFQVQDETPQAPQASSQNISQPTEEVIETPKLVEPTVRQVATSPTKNKITTLPSKKASTTQATENNKLAAETEPQYVVVAPVPTTQATETLNEQEVLEDASKGPTQLANNSVAEETLDIPEPQPVEINKPTQAKNTTDSSVSAGPAIAIGGNENSNVRTLEQLKQVPGNEVPKYDSDDRLHKRQGDVTFWAYVNKQGSLEKFKLIESTGFRELDFKTLRVLRSWKFYPGQEGWVEIPYSWSLKGEAQIKPTTLRRSSQL